MMKKFSFTIFVFVVSCFCFSNCIPMEQFDGSISDKSFCNELSLLSRRYDIPIHYDASTIKKTPQTMAQIEFGMHALRSMIDGTIETFQISSDSIIIVPQVSSAPLLLPKSEITGVPIGDESWTCCFYISWDNGIDVKYSAESGWETFDDEVISAYVNHINERVCLDANFYLSLGGVETVGRYSIQGYYDLVNREEHFTLSRIG